MPCLVRLFCALGLACGLGWVARAAAQGQPPPWAHALLAAYPEHLERIEGNTLLWRDGTPMQLDDGIAAKPFEDWLARPDIEDMFRYPYIAGAPPEPPAADHDPGRARNSAFFEKMYGDCRNGGVTASLVDVAWLPARSSQRLKVTRVNGVADRVQALSRELDELPSRFDAYLVPAAGAYVCRVIAGTSTPSAHGYGIAIDIATAKSHYWRWDKPGADGQPTYRNEIPSEIVRIFEKHGFIWGGRWSHYDTMHFEYRPELLPAPASTQVPISKPGP